MYNTKTSSTADHRLNRKLFVSASEIRRVSLCLHRPSETGMYHLSDLTMKPAKPASSTMNEQTSVPATMRAVYYPQIQTGNEAWTRVDYTKNHSETDTSLTLEALLDTDYPTPQASACQYLLKIQTATWGHMEAPPTKTVSPNSFIVRHQVPRSVR